MPDALRDYLLQANATWTTKPAYLTLAGDASINPRQIECQSTCFKEWTVDESLVPTYIIATDRQIGMVPSDHFYSTLEGNDDLPDIAVGRLPAKTAAELKAIIDKIITYEANLASASEWQQNTLFLSDNKDGAGDFCRYNQLVMDTYDKFRKFHYCLDEISIESMRENMFSRINEGILLASYLGHGFVDGWASEGLLDAVDMQMLTNKDKPFIQLSGNCLDTNYAWVTGEAISESLLQYEGGGTAAHWGATGLGYMIEHKVLHRYFHQALFDEDITRIGDAIAFAKRGYINYGFYAPQGYTSTLLGDPAMQVMHAEISVDQVVTTSHLDVSKPIEFKVSISNSGVRASDVTFEFELPMGGVEIEDIDSAYPVTMTENGFTMDIAELAWGESTAITVTTKVTNRSTAAVKSVVSVTSDTFEVNLDDNEAVATLYATTPTAVQLQGVGATVQLTALNLLTVVLLLVGATGVFVKKQ